MLFGPYTSCEVHRVRTEGAVTVVELRPTISSGLRRDEVQLQAEQYLAAMLNMFRAAPDAILGAIDDERIDDEVNAAPPAAPKRSSTASVVPVDVGRTSSQAHPLSTISGRAAANHATVTLLSRTFTALDEATKSEAEMISAAAAGLGPDADLDLVALAQGAALCERRVTAEACRFQEDERTAQRDRRAVDALRDESAQVRLRRREMAQARFKKIKSATNAMSFSTIAVLEQQAKDKIAAARKKIAGVRRGFP